MGRTKCPYREVSFIQRVLFGGSTELYNLVPLVNVLSDRWSHLLQEVVYHSSHHHDNHRLVVDDVNLLGDEVCCHAHSQSPGPCYTCLALQETSQTSSSTRGNRLWSICGRNMVSF